MSARAAIAGAIVNDSQIQMLGYIQSDVYGPNAIDTPSRDRHFMVVRWEEILQTIKGKGPEVVSIWVHGPKELTRDYGLIDATVTRLKEILMAAEHVSGADGWTLTAASYVGASGDLFDDGYNSLCRWIRFRCACRES